MGIAMSDTTTADMLFQLNSRFAAGRAAVGEMALVQKEFKVFSPKYSLQQTFRVLHIVPADFDERRLWFKFLDRLEKYISDQEGVSGHDRIRSAYQENLESNTPLPVHMTTHSAHDDRRVLVSRGQPIVYEKQSYIVISIPTLPRGEGRAARKAAKKGSKK